MVDIDIIDDDFLEAATHYSARMLGDTKDQCYKELKRRYEEDEDLDNLVFILARHRTKYTNLPLLPNSDMCDGLARDIVDWLKQDGRKTPKKLFALLEILGREVPQWLKDHPSFQDLEHAPPKGACAAIVFRAMMDDYLKGVDKPNVRLSEG